MLITNENEVMLGVLIRPAIFRDKPAPLGFEDWIFMIFEVFFAERAFVRAGNFSDDIAVFGVFCEPFIYIFFAHNSFEDTIIMAFWKAFESF